MIAAGRIGWHDVTDSDAKGEPAAKGGEQKKKKLFDLATVRGWIEAGGALVGVVAAAVGVYLQLFPASKPSSPSRPATAVPSVMQSGTGNVVGDGNTVMIDITGYTIEQHEARLKRQEEALRAEFDQAAADGSARGSLLADDLAAVRAQLEDIGTSYKARLTDLKRSAVALEQASGQMDGASVRAAANALNAGDVEAAETVIAGARGALSESEPNDDLLTPQTVALLRPVSAEIAARDDEDVFVFRTPGTYRDRIHIRLAARSSTLIPQLVLYSADKSQIGDTYSNTPGADLNYRFVSEPDTLYHVRIGTYSPSQGAYELTVTPLESFDRFEPNDGLTKASEIQAGARISAEIMDRHDLDVYKVTCSRGGTAVEMKLINESDGLRPQVILYDENRAILHSDYGANAGSNIAWSRDLQAGEDYYISVGPYDTTSGRYSLSVGDC